MEQRIRLLLSRDDWYHQRGYWVLATAFRDAGLEVLLGGIQTPEEIVQTAIQEDVDIIGYRIMDAAPKVLIPILFDQMKAEGILNIPVVVGGIIPQAEEKIIKDLGVKAAFHPFSPLESIVDRIKELAIAARTQLEDRH
ncbi:MAG: cobalamin-dependent protein [Deltaproteobacteria bacterium]|jgi:methylmalonyl-CoA mutase C-terminal domain/subunit|nr:cobalamin-dependent protein [Deltaproteobacteria bacterium]